MTKNKKIVLIILVLSILTLAFYSLKQEKNLDISETVKNSVNTITLNQKIESVEYVYKNNNTGENLNVNYLENNEGSFVKINGDQNTNLNLKKTNDSNNVYSDGKNIWISEGQKATFTQNGKDISLALLSPIEVVYENKKDSIVIIYVNNKDGSFAVVKKDGIENTLNQIEGSASAKGADYQNGSTTLSVTDHKAFLVVDGNSFEYAEKR